jgi:hypothetical protein
VDLIVVDELLGEFSREALPLLRADEVSRASQSDGTTRITLDMPYVPDGAVSVEPIFQRTPDGVRVQSLAWHYAA